MAAYIVRDERCIFIGNLDSRVTEEILWELFLQVQNACERFKTMFYKTCLIYPNIDIFLKK